MTSTVPSESSARSGPPLLSVLLFFSLLVCATARAFCPVPVAWCAEAGEDSTLAGARASGVPGGAGPEAEIPFDISADNLRGKAGTDQDFLLLEGNVRIVHGTTVATGATGIYFRSTRLATLGGGVRIVDGETIMTSRRATYSLATETATLQENVTITNRGAVLKGETAEFRRRENQAVLTGNVTLVDSTRSIKADRIVYDRDTETVEAFGKVTASDSNENSTVTGGHALYNRRSEVAVVTSAPHLVMTEEDGVETRVNGEQMEFSMDQDVFRARGGVRILRKDMEASCQLAEFNRKENRVILAGNPRAWDEDGEIRGDTLELLTDGAELRTVKVFGHSEVFYRAPEGEEPETSRVVGDSIRIVMDDEEIDEVFVYGHARSDYFAVAEGEPVRNVASGDTVHLRVENRKPTTATFEGSTSGVYNFSTASGDSLVKEQVDYSSKKIEFYIDDKLIRLSGDAEMKYKNLRLVAQEVEFDSDKQTLEATGEPVLWESEEKVTGDRMTYSLETARGTIYEGRTRFQKGFYTGDEIRKVGDKILNVRAAEYTSCELKEPHYHFSSQRMRIYLNDKVIARPLVFYVRKVPLLALPFYVFPIKPGRHSGFLIPQVEFGFNSTKGRFVRNAGYYWAVNDYADVTGWMDYFENGPRWIAYLETRYNVRYRLSGSLNFSYSDNPGLGTSQWDLQGNHLQKLGEDLNLSMEGDFVSDKNYRLDRGLGRGFEERVNRILRSKMSLTKRWSQAQLTAAYDRTAYMDTDPEDSVDELKRLELRPTVSFSMSSRAIGGTAKPGASKGWRDWFKATYVSASTSLLSQARVYETHEEEHTGMSTRLGIRDSRKLLGIVNVSPSLSYTEDWYDEDLLGNKLERAGVWSASVAGSATLFRIFRLPAGPLDAVRHSLSPTVQFSYQPDFPQYSYVDTLGVRRSRFPSFGGISTSWSKRQSVSLSLYNRFQAKLKWKDRVIRLDDLLDVTLSTAYDFLYRENSKSQPLSDVNTSIRLKPVQNFSSELFLTHDPVSKHLSSLSFVSYLTLQSRAGASADTAGQRGTRAEAPSLEGEVSEQAEEVERSVPSLPWQGTFTFRYSRGAEAASASYWLDGNAALYLSKNWRVEYGAHYDLKERQVVSQTFSLYRDLHCWEAIFTRRFSGQRWEYYFKINIKAHKEIYIERGSAIS
ncbi:MAG: hypothetical protein JW952_02805 [Candidatus Eisenbacteria bacterium]|nr:hypothetical protein [Candidatus Eisenbacteria bacterium]